MSSVRILSNKRAKSQIKFGLFQARVLSSKAQRYEKNQGDRFLNETMKWISLQKPVPLILHECSQ